MDIATRWRPPLLWRAGQVLARGLLVPFARLRVTGDVPEDLRRGPLILAANHISPVDPIVLTAACQRRRIAPRIMATGGLFRTPVIGTAMRHFGHLRVDRRTPQVGRAVEEAAGAVAAGSVVLVYPEGRIGLDPHMWPERGKTGSARLALASGAPVIPVAHWGSHEVVPYGAPKGLARGLGRAMLRRPVVRVHFGEPVDLAGLEPARPGTALRATARIIDALTETLRPLRADEPNQPRYVDPGRPVDPRWDRPRPGSPAGPAD
jgi:1-acyl-sn-glycerol-3-phosphate acyltransferase